jgi:hypothetical protein
VGVQHNTVAPWSRTARKRAELFMPPPGKQRQPRRKPASKASQNPMNGPKLNAKKILSDAVTPAARKMVCQLPSNQSHDSGVSSQRNGTPPVPLV